ncbi:uncharacterized protein VDAG_00504 [Verticillium dahliae VdLs.17]|uniref:Uncharacterized protein n=1 Tax=Verticillium dahliae (strain VdLs.17 / ATCC MYA-4575 / FGSC 10137) TaxID=498257 RepID=G2WQ62_VERDV|nr:uncharacterized protein VDAG_00504 [Verticillium dahliae VdLs.17]EGY13822.1 hypothetical protein VDAG_00504 [Verticillium dahliae VdLs.17]KAH6710291.1 hypothetical protein EV126DRAFT_407038 [Verticillium dahliae]
MLPSMLYTTTSADTNTARTAVCEMLRKRPHPNLAQYQGCIVSRGRVPRWLILHALSPVAGVSAQSRALEQGGFNHLPRIPKAEGCNGHTFSLMRHRVRSFRGVEKATMNVLSRSNMSALAGLRSSTVGWQLEYHVDNIQIGRSSNNANLLW